MIDPDSDEDDLNNAVNALSIFQLQENTDEGENVNCKQYLISVGSFLQVYMIIKYVKAALSFRQCCNVPLDKASDWACTNWQNQHDKSHFVHWIHVCHDISDDAGYFDFFVVFLNSF